MTRWDSFEAFIIMAYVKNTVKCVERRKELRHSQAKLISENYCVFLKFKSKLGGFYRIEFFSKNDYS